MHEKLKQQNWFSKLNQRESGPNRKNSSTEEAQTNSRSSPATSKGKAPISKQNSTKTPANPIQNAKPAVQRKTSEPVQSSSKATAKNAANNSNTRKLSQPNSLKIKSTSNGSSAAPKVAESSNLTKPMSQQNKNQHNCETVQVKKDNTQKTENFSLKSETPNGAGDDRSESSTVELGSTKSSTEVSAPPKNRTGNEVSYMPRLGEHFCSYQFFADLF